ECTMCCRGEAIFLYPEDGDNPGLYKTRQIWHPLENRPAHMLEQRNGACIYLGEHGCTIYDKRPSTCRTYDCRRLVVKFTRALHTPLMSVTNAISSVIVVGALVAVAVPALDDAAWISKILGFVALILASVNIFGGFLVTSRMLAMYKKKAK